MLHNTKISIIAAIDEKNGLGKDNDLLFKIPADMKRVRSLTTNHTLIMGRKTFESLGRKLPNRLHIVITHDPASLKNVSFQPDIVVGSLEEALRQAQGKTKQTSLRGSRLNRETKQSHDGDRHASQGSGQYPASFAMTETAEVFIFGGGQIFKEAIEKDLVDRLYLTVVKGDYGADVFFPDYSQFTNVLKKEEYEEDGYKFTFLDLEK